jgi:hypothetical protein
MKDFMFLFYTKEEDMKKVPEEEMKKIMDKWGTWMKKLSDKGIWEGGDRLSPQNIITLRGKDKIVTDGPYSETKEIVGGYVKIKAENIDEAAEIAKECPIFLVNGNLEIRTSYV